MRKKKANKPVTPERLANACVRLESLRFAYEAMRYCILTSQACKSKKHKRDKDHDICLQCCVHGSGVVELMHQLMDVFFSDHKKLDAFLSKALPMIETDT